jgi:hypothetical protein
MRSIPLLFDSVVRRFPARVGPALVAAGLLCWGASAFAQDQAPPKPSAPPSTPGVNASSTEDAAPPRLTISTERIRELLQDPAPIQQSLEQQPTFRIRIEERDKFLQFLKTTLSVEPADTRPPPPGGIYAYEQQRVALAAIDRSGTRMEPYAVFSGPELITLALEGLARKYLGGRALDAVTDFERKRAEAAAREEVTRTIRQYCAAQPSYGTGIVICAESVNP